MVKKIRRTRIILQTNELVIIGRDAFNAQNNSAADKPNPVIQFCPLCHLPLAQLETAELSEVKDFDSLDGQTN